MIQPAGVGNSEYVSELRKNYCTSAESRHPIPWHHSLDELMTGKVGSVNEGRAKMKFSDDFHVLQL